MSFKTLRKRIALVAVAALSSGGIALTPAQASQWGAADLLDCQTGYVTTVTCVGIAGGQVVIDNNAYTTSADMYIEVSGATIVAVDTDSTNATFNFEYGSQAASATPADWPATGNLSPDTDGLIKVDHIAAAAETAGDESFTITRTDAGTSTITVFSYDATTGARVVSETHTVSWLAAANTAISEANSTFTLVASAAGCASATDKSSQDAALAAVARSTMDYRVAASATNRAIFACLIVRDGAGTLFDANNIDSVTLTTSIGSFTAGSIDRADAKGDFTDSAGNAIGAADYAINSEMFGDGIAPGAGTVSVTVVEGTAAFTKSVAITYTGEIAAVKLDIVTTSATPADTSAFGLDYETATSSTTKGDTTIFARISGTDSGGRTSAGFDVDGDGDTTGDDTIYYIVDSSVTAGSPTFSSSNPSSVTEAGAPAFTAVLDTGRDSAVNGYEQYLMADINAAVPTQKLTLKVCIDDAATSGTQATICSNTVDVYLAGAAATIAVSTDKATVEAGGVVKVNVDAKDAKGYPIADGTSISLLASNGSSVAPTAVTTAAGKFATAATLVASSNSNDTVVTAVSGNVSGTAKVTITGSTAGSVDAQISALVAAIAKLQKAINKINKRLS